MDQKIIDKIKEIVDPKYVLTKEMELLLYSYDAFLDKYKPDVVVLPSSTEEVSKIVKLCYENNISVVGRGSGTNLSGGTVPTRGGVMFHFSRMTNILDVDFENLTVTVEPGIFTLDLQNFVASKGFAYVPDPSSQKVSTMGGNVCENSGGAHCLKYGTTTNHVRGLEIVLNDGTIINTGGKAQDYPGYDLTGILTGSEGTLGIITKIILNLMKPVEAINTMMAVYDTITDAANTVSAIISDGIIPACLEMMDNTVMRAVDAALNMGYPLDAAGILIIELDGMPEGLNEKAQKIIEICKKNNAKEIKVPKNAAERMAIWNGRKGAFGAMGQIRPAYLVCDGTVPRNKLPEVLARVEEISKEFRLEIGNVFHAGDGNLHPLILFDERDEEEKQRTLAASTAILKACADVGGTISGEHGVGLEKLKEIAFIFSKEDLQFAKKVKQAFDPTDIVNPDKMIPAA